VPARAVAFQSSWPADPTHVARSWCSSATAGACDTQRRAPPAGRAGRTRCAAHREPPPVVAQAQGTGPPREPQRTNTRAGSAARPAARAARATAVTASCTVRWPGALTRRTATGVRTAGVGCVFNRERPVGGVGVDESHVGARGRACGWRIAHAAMIRFRPGAEDATGRMRDAPTERARASADHLSVTTPPPGRSLLNNATGDASGFEPLVQCAA